MQNAWQLCAFVCDLLTCRMVRTLRDVRLCCLDFLSRSMSSRPSSSSLVSMAIASSPIVPRPEQKIDTLNTWLCLRSGLQLHQQINPTKLYIKHDIMKSPEPGVLSSQELSVSVSLSHVKRQVSSSVLRDLICRGQTLSSAGRLQSVH